MTSLLHCLTTQCKRFFSGKKQQQTKLAEEVRERGAEINRTLMEQKFQKYGQQTTNDGHTMPSRWNKVTYGELHAYQVLSSAADTAQQLPDRAWGLLNEVAAVFAADGKQLTDEDMEALSTLVEKDANIANTSLATLYDAFMLRSAAVDNVRLNSIKVRGASQDTAV